VEIVKDQGELFRCYFLMKIVLFVVELEGFAKFWDITCINMNKLKHPHLVGRNIIIDTEQ